MGALPLLVALAAVSGHISFAGAVVTPTASSDAGTYTTTHQPPAHSTRIGRFNGPARTVRVEPARRVDAPAEVVVTYL